MYIKYRMITKYEIIKVHNFILIKKFIQYNYTGIMRVSTYTVWKNKISGLFQDFLVLENLNFLDIFMIT